MSKEVARKNLELQPCERWAHTEYSLNYSPAYMAKRAGCAEDAPDLMQRANRALQIDFQFGTGHGPINWGQVGRVTDMGHADYAAGGTDRRDMHESPFKSVEEVWAFDAVAEYGLPDMEETVQWCRDMFEKRQAENPDQICTGGYYRTVVSGAIQTFGWEMLLMGAADMSKMEKVFESFARFTLHHVKAWAQTDIEYFIQHDDFVWSSGPFMAPAYYRSAIIPHYAEMWKVLHDAGKKVLFCSDGDYSVFADDLAEAGADGFIFEPFVDFDMMADKFGQTHCLIGSHVDCRDMTFGDADKVRRDLDRTFETLATRCKGAILAVGNHLPPNIPEEMFDLYFDKLLEMMPRSRVAYSAMAVRPNLACGPGGHPMRFPKAGLVLLALAAFFLFAAASHAADSSDAACRERLATLRGIVRSELWQTERRLTRSNHRPSPHELTGAALWAMQMYEPDRAAPQAEAYLRRAFDAQDMKPESATYGGLPWRIGDDSISDLNAVEFALQPLGPLLIEYGDAFSKDFLAYLRPRVRASVEATLRRDVETTYTNIYVTRMVDVAILGGWLGNEELIDRAETLTDAWIELTRRQGVWEYLSPTYYRVAMDSLDLGYLYAPRASLRGKFAKALDLFWLDTAAHFAPWRAVPSLVGPHSRDADFLLGRGGIALFPYIAGWLDAAPVAELSNPGVGKSFPLLPAQARRGYRPRQEMTDVRLLPERVVHARWGPEPGQDRYTWVTPFLAFGSSSYNTGPYDKLVALDFASKRMLPTIQIQPDTLDEPYGRRRFKSRTGHSRAVHPYLNPTSVQQKGALLVLTDVRFKYLRDPENITVATNVIIPAPADEVALDGKALSVDGPFRLESRADSVLALRVGRAGVAMRFVTARSDMGQEPFYCLQADHAGLRFDAARFTVYHYRGGKEEPPGERRAQTGLLMLAGECVGERGLSALADKVAKAQVQVKSDGRSIYVDARMDGTRLEIGRDTLEGRMLRRRIDGRDVAAPWFEVNGRDMGPVVWGK